MHLTEEQRMIRETVRKFALEEVEPLAIEIDRDHRFPEETLPKMAEMGLLGINIGDKYGGAGMDDLCYTIAVEELGPRLRLHRVDAGRAHLPLHLPALRLRQ